MAFRRVKNKKVASTTKLVGKKVAFRCNMSNNHNIAFFCTKLYNYLVLS
jgi:hypothetical protein